MKDPARMSNYELRSEIKRHRNTLDRIVKSEEGCLASIYQFIARDALAFEERLHDGLNQDEGPMASALHGEYL